MKYLLKLSFTFIAFAFIFSACSDDSSTNEDGVEETGIDPIEDTGGDDGSGDTDDTTSEVYDISTLLALFEGTGLTFEVTDESVIFTTPDLPNHTSTYWETSNALYEPYNGTNPNFNQNPNLITEQNIVFTIPLQPVAAETNEETRLGPIGISRNGVVFFNQYAGPDNQPLTSEINSFDQAAAHPTGAGIYHYHIEPLFLTEDFGADAFLGLLADGFAVYGPMENGEEITNADLDEFHGHISATTEFPDGVYHYHITSEDPYINGGGYYGTPGNISR